jgi:hypothetical protein
MDEIFKTKIVLILAVLTVVFFIGTVSSCGNVYKYRAAKEMEMARRLGLEEKMSKFIQEKDSLTENSAALQKRLDQETADHETTRQALKQEQLVNQSLKEELVKTTKLKEALEEDLKVALIQDKGSAKVAPSTIKP